MAYFGWVFTHVSDVLYMKNSILKALCKISKKKLDIIILFLKI